MTSCIRNSSTYKIEVEYCSGHIDTIDYIGYTKPRISTYRRAVPIIDGTNGWNVGEGTVIINVCKFRILE